MSGDLHDRAMVEEKLKLLIKEFEKALYDKDDIFLENMKTKNRAGDDISRYINWEWPQGVGLFGLWKFYERTGNQEILSTIIKYYERQFAVGFPAKNINTMAPLLALSYLYESNKEERYGKLCMEWAEWLMKDLPRTKENGFQHITSDTVNYQELWDDTLFMAVLFLARMGKLTGTKEWIKEAEYQFLLHIKYLTDQKTGLWFHGWTFDGNHNFAQALWGRGNSWATIAIPELVSILGKDCDADCKTTLTQAINKQVSALKKYQDKSGMWHTLIDDPDSYVETSATCGFGYGILRAARMGLIDKEYIACALRALGPVLNYIDSSGIVNQVSYGTAMGRNDKQFYKEIEIRPMPYGPAMAILYLLEVVEQIS